MKNLIYQYWLGKPGIAVQAGIDNMKAYAERIGAEYRFVKDPKWAAKYCDIPAYYNAFEPVYNKDFWEYDNILFADTDVFAVEGLEENIFDQDVGHIGICDEPHKEISHLKTKSHINTASDERWNKLMVDKYGKEMPRNESGNLKIFNSGVVLYTNEGLRHAHDNWVGFQGYINHCRNAGLNKFYSIDQNYLHAMLTIGEMDYTVMHSGWNSYVHYDGDSKTTPRAVIDTRTEETKLVHVQLRNADNQDANWHKVVVNQPVSEWKLVA
jgi:hypothetical protein